ncbi:MAG: recombinase family protein [Candidatus Omnitrophota bacterium]|nr:recombinase family protein [Candidatus Omnitrophota bacterium]
MNCAIYIRVSTEKQREKFSLPAQLKILTEHAKLKTWNYTVYDEGAGSGETLENRPQMLRLLGDAREKKFDVCLVIELERLSRDEDLFDWLTIKKTFRDNKIKMATPNQTYDLSDDEDDFLSDLFGALAKREKKKLLKRMKRGALEAVSKGVYIGGHFRIGYKYDKTTKKLIVVPEEAEVVKTIFKLCNEENMGTVAIAEYLNSKRILTPLEFAQRKGYLTKECRFKIGRWTGGVVWRILTNPIYYGIYYYNKVEQKNGKTIGKRPESEWVKQTVEPIITFNEFQMAQENIKNRAKWSNRNTKNEYLLSGLLYCAECESKLQGATFKAYEKRDDNGNLLRNKSGYLVKRWKTISYYKCYGRVKKNCTLPYKKTEDIDRKVWNAIEYLIKQPQKVLDETIEIKQKELQGRKETIPVRLKELEKELKRLTLAEDRLLDAFSMGDLTQEDLRKQMPRIKFRKSNIQAEIDSLKLQSASSEVKTQKLANLFAIKGSIDDFSKEKRREFLRDAIDKVIVYRNGDIDIITVLDNSLPQGGSFELVCSESKSRSFCSAG